MNKSTKDKTKTPKVELTAKMKRYSGTYLAESFLDYYKNKGHTVVDSAPLLPEDPTLLFTAAGMVPFKSYYSDPDAAPYAKAASVQKCLRAGGKQSDLENVGRTLRHHTFFEMLGNFSFGDYFKKEAIDTAWDLSLDVWSLEKDRIWVSVFRDDDEAWELWAKRIGIPENRIVRLGKKDNFWGPVGDTGVCGPCSELYYDTGEERGCQEDTCQPGCDCDRFIEYWNLVFPQFFYTEAGVYDPLPRPGIDTGMGLERVAFILQEVDDNFHTDLFLPIRRSIEAAIPDGDGPQGDAQVAVNVASDHVRALVFALYEGIMPSNEGRGYVLRRLLRRALTKMYPFGVRDPFLARGVDAVISTMKGRYPELVERSKFIKDVVTAEEERFLATIEQGMSKLSDVIEKTKKKKDNRVSGADAFVLYDTYGFPFEMTKEYAEDEGLEVDGAGFDAAMQEQKERGRGRSFHVVEQNGEQPGFTEVAPVAATEFDGYDSLVCDAALGLVRCYAEDDVVFVDFIPDRTVFYGESGGQVGDAGTVTFGGRTFEVHGAWHRNSHIVHRLEWGSKDEAGSEDEVVEFFRSNRTCRLEVDRVSRMATARNHTATHLLQAALRSVLGDHVAQAGSLVEPSRLRFDFQHHQAMSDDEIRAVEDQVNEAVRADIEVDKEMLPQKEALAAGAVALFGEKYGDVVRVVSIGDVSKELCGGTHLGRTGEIGAFVVRQETAIAAGIRRIEALTGDGAMAQFRKLMEERAAVAGLLKVAPEDLGRRVRSMLDDVDRMKKTIREQERRLAGGQMDDSLGSTETIGDVEFVTMTLPDENGGVEALRRWGDRVREQMGLGVGLLCLAAKKKPIVLIVASDRVQKERNLRANDLARMIGEKFSLRGGGKPHMAQLGIAKVDDFKAITAFVRDLLKENG
ncbi:MAG: alanine--tRNA ligase [Candidatus Latescibacterota bacterium]|nr:MAG: alanine--tRNA ligase [Candidatus Latescibacterota bacterium]